MKKQNRFKVILRKKWTTYVIAVFSSVAAAYTRGAVRWFFTLTAVLVLVIYIYRMLKRIPKLSTILLRFNRLKKEFLNLFNKYTEKFMSYWENAGKGVRIKNYKDEKKLIFGLREEMQRDMVLRKMKWKDLVTNNEKIRYIYISLMNKLINKGYEIRTCDTPREIERRLSEHVSFGDLIPVYNEARYDCKNIITDEEVLQLKQLDIGR